MTNQLIAFVFFFIFIVACFGCIVWGIGQMLNIRLNRNDKSNDDKQNDEGAER